MTPTPTHPLSITAEDMQKRLLRQAALAKVPDEQRDLFDALYWTMDHIIDNHVTPLDANVQLTLHIQETMEQRQKAMLTLIEEQEKRLTTLTAGIERALSVIDHGLTVSNMIEQGDVSRIDAVIGTPDGDSRPIRQHLRDIDRGLRWLGRSFAVAVVVFLLIVGAVVVFGVPDPLVAPAPPPAIGGR